MIMPVILHLVKNETPPLVPTGHERLDIDIIVLDAVAQEPNNIISTLGGTCLIFVEPHVAAVEKGGEEDIGLLIVEYGFIKFIFKCHL